MNFVIGRLSDCDKSDDSSSLTVCKVQVKVADSNDRFAWVDTDDLNDGTNRGQEIRDDLHYSGEGMLGQALWEACIGKSGVQANESARTLLLWLLPLACPPRSACPRSFDHLVLQQTTVTRSGGGLFGEKVTVSTSWGQEHSRPPGKRKMDGGGLAPAASLGHKLTIQGSNRIEGHRGGGLVCGRTIQHGLVNGEFFRGGGSRSRSSASDLPLSP